MLHKGTIGFEEKLRWDIGKKELGNTDLHRVIFPPFIPDLGHRPSENFSTIPKTSVVTRNEQEI